MKREREVEVPPHVFGALRPELALAPIKFVNQSITKETVGGDKNTRNEHRQIKRRALYSRLS